MDGTYREMILGADFVPITKLSGAFLQPKSPMHLQFAYYQASLAVEFWIENYGMNGLLKLLEDLSIGLQLEDALRRLPGSLELLDHDFEEFAKKRASEFGSGVDFSVPTTEDRKDISAWLNEHSSSVFALRSRCQALIAGKKWDQALEVALQLQRMVPEDHDNDGVYAMLTTIYRSQQDTENERAALVSLASRSADCKQAIARLVEMDRKNSDWNSVIKWCDRLIEIDPLQFDLQNDLATACEETKAFGRVVLALEACLQMDPRDPARVHYRLARALDETGQWDRATREALLALEESPRYLEALKLLAKLNQRDSIQPTEKGSEN
jgi:tetratricopeptide (TPR) repeat protein